MLCDPGSRDECRGVGCSNARWQRTLSEVMPYAKHKAAHVLVLIAAIIELGDTSWSMIL